MTKPAIETITTGTELKRWYWLKSDLSARAKALGLKTAGSKFELLDRIAVFLDTGLRKTAPAPRARKTKGFDWHGGALSRETVLTDTYKNTQNVRRFFRSELGDAFKFNIEFMAWLKGNAGKTLGDACAEYRAMKRREAAPDFVSRIAPDNQFNQYMRDFLAHHPDRTVDEVRAAWAAKTQQPSATGRHVYAPGDIDLLPDAGPDTGSDG